MSVEFATAPFQLLNDGAPCSTALLSNVLDVVPAVSSSVPIMLFMFKQLPEIFDVAADVASVHTSHVSSPKMLQCFFFP